MWVSSLYNVEKPEDVSVLRQFWSTNSLLDDSDYQFDPDVRYLAKESQLQSSDFGLVMMRASPQA
jgi:hypothetical protein